MGYVEVNRFADGSIKWRYYGGDREHALHQQVPDQPSPLHVATFDANLIFTGWVVDAKAAINVPIDAQIAALEAAQIAPRFSREGILGLILKSYMNANATLTQAQAAANLSDPKHPDYNVGYARLRIFDDKIAALRARRVL